MKPFYRDELTTIYCGDARDILPQLPAGDSIITDPVWPNSLKSLEGADRPYELFAEVASHFPRLCQRAVVVLGQDSDPRFLMGMPAEMSFLRLCWLELVRPGYKGRILYTGNVAYVFGEPPPSKKGRHLLPGRCLDTTNNGNQADHPAPRKLGHMRWLVRWFANGLVIDPFMGSGTTLLAAKMLGWPSVGIEISEKHCETAVQRLASTYCLLRNTSEDEDYMKPAIVSLFDLQKTLPQNHGPATSKNARIRGLQKRNGF